jgi:hypothetical protein
LSAQLGSEADQTWAAAAAAPLTEFWNGNNDATDNNGKIQLLLLLLLSRDVGTTNQRI